MQNATSIMLIIISVLLIMKTHTLKNTNYELGLVNQKYTNLKQSNTETRRLLAEETFKRVIIQGYPGEPVFTEEQQKTFDSNQHVIQVFSELDE